MNTTKISSKTLELVHKKFKENQYPRTKSHLSSFAEKKHFIFTILSFKSIKNINKYHQILNSPKKIDRYKKRLFLNYFLLLNFFKIKHYDKTFIWK